MRAEIFLQGLIAFLIVAFGQPSFSPYLAPIAATVGYAIFWYAIRIYPFKKQRFLRASIWYAAVTLVQLSWMSAIEYQGPYIIFVWLGISVVLGAQFGLLSILIPYNKKLRFPRIFAIASIWTLIEWSRFHFLCGYSWNLSGIALSTPFAVYLASIFGILGLSFWVILVNLTALRAFTRRGIVHYFTWAALAVTPYCFGYFHHLYHDNRMAKIEDKYHCLLVQTGVLPPEKIPIQGKIRSFISPYDQWRQILALVQAHRNSPIDLIVLPEAAVPFSCTNPLYNENFAKNLFVEFFGPLDPSIFPPVQYPYGENGKVSNAYFVQTLSNLYNSEVIAGLDHTEETGQSYNSAFFVKPHQNTLARYDKQVLMPLAEYLPFKFLIPLVRFYGITDFFTPGIGAKLFEGKLATSASICYEETFPAKVRQGRLLGAELFVNVTNDGWYPFSSLPSQHFEHGKIRAVENGVPLVRSCNTGVSAAVDSLGRTLVQLKEQVEKDRLQKGALLAAITPYTYPTLYTLWGNAGILGICFVFLGFFVGLKKHFKW